MVEDENSLEYRIKLFKESSGYKWPKPEENTEERPKSKRGRKPGPSKRIVNKNEEHYKWWRT